MTCVGEDFPRHKYSAIAKFDLESFKSLRESPYSVFQKWVEAQDIDLKIPMIVLTREDAKGLSVLTADWLKGTGADMTEFQRKSYVAWSMALGPDFFHPINPHWAGNGILYRKI